MAHPILMPKAGQTMTEGRLIAWLKKEGDSVERGEPLLEIETDKANLEVESTESGVLRKIFAGEGDVRPVLTVVGVLGDANEDIDFEALREAGDRAAAAAAEEAGDGGSSGPGGGTPAGAPAERPAARAVDPRAATPAAGNAGVALASPAAVAPAPAGRGRRFASPLARRLAEKKGIDISLLSGTGPGGRILRRDVESAPTRTAGGLGGAAGSGLVDLGGLTRSRPYAPPSPRPPERVALTGMRGAIAAALQHSKQTVPHFYETMTIDVTAALALRRNLEIGGERVSVNDLVVRACVVAITDEPRMNCRVLDDHINYPADINIGIAVGTEGGLVVPVVVEAQTLDLGALAAESRRVIESARGGKLIGTGKGTFTISNLGMFGVESFSAIINPPEGAILAVGAVGPRVVPHAGGLVPRAMMSVTLSADHRAIDGLLAAQFLARLKWLLENPERL